MSLSVEAWAHSVTRVWDGLSLWQSCPALDTALYLLNSIITKMAGKKIYHLRGRDDGESDHNDMSLSLDLSQIKTFTLLLVRDSKQASRCMPVLDISFPTNCKFLNDIVFRNVGCVSESGVSRVTTSLQREWPSPDSLQTFEAAQAVAQPLAEREAGFRSGVCMQPVTLNH